MQNTLTEEEKQEALVISELNHSFGDGENAKQVLFDNCLALKKGEVVVLMGPSGSGKTTLLTLIGALRSIQSGSITLKARELAGMKGSDQVQVRRNIGFIFQAHNLFTALNARQNVKMALELTQVPKARQWEMADAILAKVGLADRVHYKPAKLSGGQRQRVAICRALVNNPQLVLADEPTAALDKETGGQVLQLLKEMAVTLGTIVIIVSHDARVISSADRLINMIDGHIVSDIRVKETMELCQFMKACPFFEKMSVSDLTDISRKVNEQIFLSGEAVFKQDTIGDTFYIVKSGRVEVMVKNGDREEKVAELTKGQYFGEVALLKEEPRNATIIAREQTELYTLAKPDFIEAVQAHQSFDRQIFGAIAAQG